MTKEQLNCRYDLPNLNPNTTPYIDYIIGCAAQDIWAQLDQKRKDKLDYDDMEILIHIYMKNRENLENGVWEDAVIAACEEFYQGEEDDEDESE